MHVSIHCILCPNNVRIIWRVVTCADRDRQSQLCFKVHYHIGVLRHVSAYIKKAIIRWIKDTKKDYHVHHVNTATEVSTSQFCNLTFAATQVKGGLPGRAQARAIYIYIYRWTLLTFTLNNISKCKEHNNGNEIENNNTYKMDHV